MTSGRASSSRDRVTDEAALLLYMRQEKEYKQAKRRAARILGARVLPSNAEVAEALDKIATEREGEEREKRLISMRREALELMKLLCDVHPLLTGSVWRGTARKGSDVDIVTFSDSPTAVLQRLKKSNCKIIKTEWQSVTKQGRKIQTFHIHIAVASGNEAEIVVRSVERIHVKEKCEIYGDVQTGLTILQLQRVLENAPTQRFTPT